jgi:hypothetical protein
VLSHWIAETVEKTNTETVKSYLTPLRSIHIDQGIPTDVFDDPRIQRMLRGALRVYRSEPIRERGEITKDILIKMVSTFGNSHDDINLQAAFTVAFAAFLRAGEFTWDDWNNTTHLTHLSRGSVQFRDKGVLLHLPKSKTDQFRKGNDIAISPSGDSTCPVAALQLLFKKYPKSDPTSPLFS